MPAIVAWSARKCGFSVRLRSRVRPYRVTGLRWAKSRRKVMWPASSSLRRCAPEVAVRQLQLLFQAAKTHLAMTCQQHTDAQLHAVVVCKPW